MSWPPLAAFVIVRNARRTIPSVLGALSWVDDVVVVDLQSSDGSPDIASQYHRPVWAWQGPVPSIVEEVREQVLRQRNNSHQWTLFVDEDEVHVNTRIAIERHMASRATLPLIFSCREMLFRHPTGRSLEVARLFPPGYVYSASMHEALPGAVAMDGYIEHHSIPSVGKWVEKWHRYARREADLLSRADCSIALIRDFVRGPVAEIRRWWSGDRSFIGLVWHLHAAVWVFVRPVLAWRRGRRIRLGGFQEAAWGWGQPMPRSYR